MDENIILQKIDMTVGPFGDFQDFTEVIDYLFKNKGYEETLDLFGLDGIEYLSEVLVNGNGCYDEEKARFLVIDSLDGIPEEGYNPELDWGDEMYCREAGK